MDNQVTQQIQEIKQKYGNSAEDIIASGLGLIAKGKKYRCPNTHAHKHADRDPSMSWDNNAYQFYCFGCGMKIDMYSYYREHLNYTHREVIADLLGVEDYKHSKLKSSRDKFNAELIHITEITEECIDYLKTRKLEIETIKAMGLKSYKGAIAFPYYRYGTVVGYKTRKPLADPGKPKMLSIPGSKPYLFNSENVDFENDELICCEGELDCAIIWQAGFKNVVSVGAGANSVKTMIEQAEDFFKKFRTVIVFSDNDPSGEEMDRTFTELLGDKVKLIDKKLCTRKDANEEYYIHGEAKIAELIDSARLRIEGRRDVDKDPYKGIANVKGKFIPTGLKTIDEAINDFAPGCLTLITGRSNGGKTTLMKQILANAIDKGNKVYLVNGENHPEYFLNEFYQTVIGRDERFYDLVKINKRYKKEPKPEVLEQLKKWHNKKLYMFNKGESKLKKTEELLKLLEEEIKYSGHDLIIVDNMMSVLSVTAAEKNEQQADMVQRLADLAKTNNIHIGLVTHPNKTYQKGQDMDFEQISGSSDIYNKADNIISVIRYYDEENLEQGINGRIDVIKNRYYSELVKVNVFFDKETGLLLEIDEKGRRLAYNFKWQGAGLKSDRTRGLVPF